MANGTQGGSNMGMSVVEASVSGGTLTNVANHGLPANGDNDLSAGVALAGNQVLSGGKGGYVIVMNAADASSAVRSSAHWKTTSTSPCVDG